MTPGEVMEERLFKCQIVWAKDGVVVYKAVINAFSSQEAFNKFVKHMQAYQPLMDDFDVTIKELK